jgi:hypothetical protein
VIAWVDPSAVDEAAALLERSLGDVARVLPLAVADRGATA